MELHVPAYNFDFDGLLATFIEESVLAYTEPQRKRDGGFSRNMYRGLLVSWLTNSSVKATAERFDISYDGLKGARWKHDRHVVANLEGFYSLIFSEMIGTAVKRAGVQFVTGKQGECDKSTLCVLERKPVSINADSLSPYTFSGIIDWLCTFLKDNRAIRRILRDRSSKACPVICHAQAGLLFRSVQLAAEYLAPVGLDYDQIVGRVLPMVVVELYRNCAIPLLGTYREKMGSMCSMMRCQLDSRAGAETWWYWVREALTQATAEIFLDLIEAKQEDHGCVLRKTESMLWEFGFFFSADSDPQKGGVIE